MQPERPAFIMCAAAVSGGHGEPNLTHFSGPAIESEGAATGPFPAILGAADLEQRSHLAARQEFSELPAFSCSRVLTDNWLYATLVSDRK